jgi:magnesium-transporting ATPase (P-type)
MNLRKNWWKISGLIIIAVLINAVGHFIDGTRLWTDIDPLSIFSKAIGIEAVATIFFIVFFFSMSVTFLLIERWLSGSKIVKGLKFGISWGVIFFLGGIETYPVFGKSSLFSDMRLCFVDLISVVAFGALLGRFLASDDPRVKTRDKTRAKTKTKNSGGLSNDGLILLVTTFLYCGGRYFAYSVLKIESGFIERPVSTFIWTLAMGVSFGALYILTGRNLTETGLIKRSAFFGLLNVGTNWLVFNLFWPFVYQSSVWRFAEFIVGRAIVDIGFVILGVYASERLISMKEKRT